MVAKTLGNEDTRRWSRC